MARSRIAKDVGRKLKGEATSPFIRSRREIPDAPFYVLSNDTFMSGWGWAQGRINTVILPAYSLEEAEIIAENARNRSDQQRVRIVGNKPKLRRDVHYSLLTRENAGRWYEPGGFGGFADRIGQVKPRRVPSWVVEAEKSQKEPGVQRFFFLLVGEHFIETNPETPWEYLKRNIACAYAPGLRAAGLWAYIVPSKKLVDWVGQFIEDVPPELLVSVQPMKVAVVPKLYRTVMQPLRDMLYQAMLERGADQLFESHQAGLVTPFVCEDNEWIVDDVQFYSDLPTSQRESARRFKKAAKKVAKRKRKGQTR